MIVVYIFPLLTGVDISLKLLYQVKARFSLVKQVRGKNSKSKKQDWENVCVYSSNYCMKVVKNLEK